MFVLFSEGDDLLGCFSFELDQIGKYCGREWYLIFPKLIGVSMNLRSSDLSRVTSYRNFMTVSGWEDNDHRSAGFKTLVSGFKSHVYMLFLIIFQTLLGRLLRIVAQNSSVNICLNANIRHWYCDTNGRGAASVCYRRDKA